MSQLFACYRGTSEGTVRLGRCPSGYASHSLGWVSNIANPGDTRTRAGEVWGTVLGYQMLTYSGRSEDYRTWSRLFNVGQVWPTASH